MQDATQSNRKRPPGRALCDSWLPAELSSRLLGSQLCLHFHVSPSSFWFLGSLVFHFGDSVVLLLWGSMSHLDKNEPVIPNA